MGNWYVKAGTVFDDPSCKFYVYLNLTGYDEDDYETQDDSDISAEDPFLKLGGTGGVKEVQIGLDSHYRIRITDTGIEAWDEGSSAWVDLIAGGIAGNIFKVIDVPAGTNPVADGPVDTLILTSGNNILTITGDETTDTINFIVVEGNITHNNIGGIDAGDIKHLTAAQIAALHAKSHAHDGVDGSGTVAHSDTTGRGTDDHHAESHNIASHSDTTATGAELETLTDGSDADALHNHETLLITKTGWNPDVDAAISFNDGTRTFTITPNGNQDYYISNVKYTISLADTVIINDTEGLWFIYYVGNTLTGSQTPWVIEEDNKAMVSILYWDATNNLCIILTTQTHSWKMDAETHYRLHDVNGAQISTGGSLSDMTVDGDGSADAQAQFQNDATDIHDEDIEIQHSARIKASNLPVYYRDGVDGSLIWRVDEDDPYPIANTGGAGEDRAAWNELTGGNWQLTEITDNKFVLSHIIVTTDENRPYICVCGQAEYASKSAAREGAETELTNIILAGLTTEEFRVIATIIIQTKDTYGNTPKSKIVSTAEGGDYIDWTTTVLSRTGISQVSQISDDAWDGVGGTFSGITTIGLSKNVFDDAIKDEDNMASDSNIHVATQQSTKAYIDALIAALHARQHSIIDALDHTMGNDKTIYSTGAGVLTELVHGDAGKYLKSQGLGAALIWDTPAGGGHEDQTLYYVTTAQEFLDAITAIEAGNEMGTIHILADLANVQAVINDASAGFTIIGHGHTLDANGSNHILTVTAAKHLEVRNCKFDGTDFTGVKYCLYIATITDYCYIHHNYFTGDAVNGYALYCGVTSTTMIFVNNYLEKLNIGYYGFCYYSVVANNVVFDMAHSGLVFKSSYYSVMNNNTISQCASRGIWFDGSFYCTCNGNTAYNNQDGISIGSPGDESVILGNNSSNNTRYGIRIEHANCAENFIIANQVRNNGTADVSDAGTNTQIDHNHS